MKICDRLRASIIRSTESETSPEESLRVAGHLASCTACRIVAARARRLAQALDAMDDGVAHDDESFLRDVMAALPSVPPPPSSGVARRRLEWIRRKRIHIAGLLAVAMLAGLAASPVITSGSLPELAALPNLSDSPDGIAGALSTLAALANVALEGLGWGGRVATPLPTLGAVSAIALAIAGFAAATAGALAIATGAASASRFASVPSPKSR